MLNLASDRLFTIIGYRYLHFKCRVPSPRIEWESPSRFNHKLIWLKHNYKKSDAGKFVDKIEVKKFVAKVIGERYIIPTLGVWSRAEDINFDELPNEFILKASHGSGWNLIVRDKSKINIEDVKATANSWLKQDYGRQGREYQYSGVCPRLLAEPLLNQKGAADLLDYKFFCFHGEPKFIQLDSERYTDHKRDFYDLEWSPLPFTLLYKKSGREAEPPNQFDDMKKIASKLSEDFIFARIDLYSVNSRIYFGEITFHPEGGFGPILPDNWDFKLGKLLELPLASH